MEYPVIQDWTIEGKTLLAGGVVKDGDFEPDVIAQLLSNRVLALEVPAEEAPEPKAKPHKSK